MRWLPPTRPPSPHFTWQEVIGNSGYFVVPYGPTPIGHGRFVLTPRLNARKHAANLERLRAAVNEARRLKGFPATGIRLLSWARSYAENCLLVALRRAKCRGRGTSTTVITPRPSS